MSALAANYIKGLINKLYKTGHSHWKRFGAFAFLLLALIAMIAVVLLDGRRVLAYTFHLDPLFVTLSVFVEFSGLILAVPAWHLILVRLGANITPKDNLRLYCYSFVGFVIPGTIWPFVGRAALYEREGISAALVTVATVIEFILMGLAAFVIYVFTLSMYSDQTFWQRREVALIVAVLAFFFIQPSVFNRVSAFILRRTNQVLVPGVKLSYMDLGVLLILESLTVLVGGTAVYFLLRSFVVISSGLYFTVVGAWAAGIVASNLFFWLPGKLVIRDGATILALTQALPSSLAVIFVIIVRLWTIASVVIAVVLAWLLFRHKARHF